ncbi:MAG: tungstate ABC transporter substrate-binding protein WtpA, partial [Dehalococcoidales bacterium]|nr:tungstate ABC transporter substrate-binding protein WtpA [Dehalococcoidales bacterium]
MTDTSPGIKMKKWLLISTSLIICASLFLTGCHASKEKTVLKVFEAGSLMVPFAEIETAFEAKYPDIDVQMEGHGSIQVIRHITEIHQDIDIAAVADASLIPLLMYQTNTPEGKPYADWTISFATNRLGIAYTKESKFAGEITASNWYDILMRNGVKFGFADPRLDAIGYRALILTQLAEAYYGDSGIFERTISQNFSPPIRTRLVDGKTNINVSELIDPKSANLLMRGFSIQLLALLESREIDYAFEYESVAKQHNLEFLELPPQIDLSSAQYADKYAQVQVSLD